MQIIKDGGYATSLTYVEKLISIIERWNLTQYDVKDSGGDLIRWYRVRKSWADSKTQKGAYKILDNAKKCADQNPGYKVFDVDGKVVYEPKAAEPAVKVPFLVKVKINDQDRGRILIEFALLSLVCTRSWKSSPAKARLRAGGYYSQPLSRKVFSCFFLHENPGQY